MSSPKIEAVDVPPFPEPGQKIRGTLRFSHPTLTGWEWPFVAARGLQDGPTVSLTSGVHAGEYPPMVANIRFMRELDPATLRGSIISIPVVDPPALYARSAFVCPIDGKNPNRFFPGTPTGTFTEVLAHAIFTNVISRSTHLIDLHCGDVFEYLAPFTIYRQSGNDEVDATAAGMAAAFGLPRVVFTPLGASPLSGTTSATCAGAGIPAITTEAGGRGLFSEEETAMQVAGIANVLRFLGVLEGDVATRPGQRTFGSSRPVFTPSEGLWFPEVDLLQDVVAGQRIGRVENLFGEQVAEITAPADGIVLYLTSSPAVRSDGLLGSIAGGEATGTP